jgi:hypothetical protein
MSRDEFRQLQCDRQVRTREGHVWTVRANAYLDQELGEYRVVLFAGAQVLVEKERFHDVYMLLPA